MDTLLKDMPLESIPVCIGGKFEQYNEAYEFDVSEGGPLHCVTQRAPIPSSAESATIISETRGVVSEDQSPAVQTSSDDVVKDSVPNISKEFEPAINVKTLA